jgi:hypothetical protein
MKILTMGAELFHADGRTDVLLFLRQLFPNFFHMRTPWQPISINCTLHIRKMFVINTVGVISYLCVDVYAFLRH